MKKISTLLFAMMLCICANAQKNLATVINDAVASLSSKYEVVPVFLDAHESYVLDSQVNLGNQMIAIWGGDAIVTVSGEGQIATQTYLQVRNVKFDLEAAKNAPVALEANADESLMTMANYPGANQNWPHANYKISIVNCAFREVSNGIFSTNGANWAIHFLTIDGCVAQIAEKVANPVLNIKGSVKNLTMTNNTFYKVGTTSDKVFVSFGNASNGQPQKVWGTDATAKWNVQNNTFAQVFGNKAFGDQIPSKNNITITAKKNIFYNTFRFQNKFVGNGKKDYTADDNIQFCNLESSTVESGLGNEVDPGFTMPEGALDLNNVAALKANFGVKFGLSSFGCQKWYNTVLDNAIKAAGKNFALILGPDMLEMGTKDGAAKPAIAKAYPWIEYINPTSTLDDGRAEVQQSNRWTDIDPAAGTGEHGDFIQATGKNGSVNSPVISKQWGKVMNLYVTNMDKVVVYATGSASGSAADGNGILLTATANDGTVVTAQTEPGSIYGKGNASACCAIELDPAKVWQVEINSLVEKDMQITGLNLYVHQEYHSPAVAAGEFKETVLGPDMLTTGKKEGASKPCINSKAYPWIEYVNPTSVLDNGAAEVQQSNRWTDIDPVTGQKGDFIQVTGKNGSVNSPVISAQWGKYLTFAVTNTAMFEVYATGSASGSAADGNYVLISALAAGEDTPETAQSNPGDIYGKGNGSGMASLLLDPAKNYIVSVMGAPEVNKDIQITGIALLPLESIARVAKEGATDGIETIQVVKTTNGAAYNVAGQRVNLNTKGLIIVDGKKFINK